MAAIPPTIPLDCTICPKKPKFSDVSHLLTHIGSKGHLSHYYKLRIKANTDPISLAQYHAYDTWYTQWGVEALMSERMSLKDKKKPRNRNTASRASSVASSIPQQPRAPRGRPPGSGKATSTAKVVQSSNLSNSIASNAIQANSAAYNANLSMMASGPVQQPWPSVWPRLAQTGLIPMMSRPATAFESYNAHFNKALAEHHGFMSRPPSTLSAFDDTTSNSILSSPPEILETPSVTDESVASLESTESAATGEVNEDKSKLKGIQWPGMSLFDSATPEAKRKRNQKKDASVIERLETESRDIEATEQVWSPGGNLQREKLITGMPSSSPVLDALDVTPLPPKRSRAALSQIHGRRSTRTTQLGRPSTWEDDEREHDLTYGHPRHGRQNKRRKALDVYEDKPDIEDLDDEPASFRRARDMTQLTREFDPDQKENVAPLRKHGKFEMDKYIHIDDDDFGSQAIYGRPIQPQRFHEAIPPRQVKFSMAQPMSQPTMPITVPIDLTAAYGDGATGMFGHALGRIYDHTVNPWQQTSDFPGHGLSVITTPQSNHFLSMLPPMSGNRNEGSSHWRNSSNEMRMLSGHNAFAQLFGRPVSVTAESPLRRTQSQPLPMAAYAGVDAATYIKNAAQQDAALRALTDAATLVDRTARFESLINAAKDGLDPNTSMVMDDYDRKGSLPVDHDDDDRTLTDLPSSASLMIEQTQQF